jgi:acrylyl-CoA reductase (NADPH)
MSKQKWIGVIDTVGGEILSSLLTETAYDGIVVSTGLASSAKLSTTVYPFILRNITLAGIDCVYASYQKRVKAWNFLEKNLDKKILEKIKVSADFSKLKSISKKILDGKVKGRTVIKIIK